MPSHVFHGIYEVLLITHQTPEQTPSESTFSVFLRCPHNCIFEDSTGHNGPDRSRNTNLSALVSETMWSQPILIELLPVILLLQTHIHFPSCNQCVSGTVVVLFFEAVIMEGVLKAKMRFISQFHYQRHKTSINLCGIKL